MKHTPFFKFDAMSWLGGSIQFASLEEKGLFVDICAMYWNTWEPVQINQRFKVRYRYLEGTLSDLLGTLSDLGVITSTTQGYTVPFLDELISARQDWLDKCSKAGKKSAAAKGTSSNKKEESRKKRVESREKKVEKGQYSQEFEDWWAKLKNKTEKAKSFPAWKQATALMTDDEASELADKLNAYWTAGLERDPTWSPIHASTWLNQRRWEDEPMARPSNPDNQKISPQDWGAPAAKYSQEDF